MINHMSPSSLFLEKPHDSGSEFFGDARADICTPNDSSITLECNKRLNYDDFDDTCQVASKRLKQGPFQEIPNFHATSNGEGNSSSHCFTNEPIREEEECESDEFCFLGGPLYHKFYDQEVFPPIYEYAPRKPVAIGPNHQADIPDFNPKTLTLTNRESDKWLGTCVLPMPDLTQLLTTIYHKSECDCHDGGSIQCVQQHVTEERERIKKTLGQEKFAQLGFCEIGEEVALRWTGEEEQLFNEIVQCNPASFGKNFWDELPNSFPNKTNRELVSYYFNVFVLRKRVRQNRSDPLNIDSDNDEWEMELQELDEREEDSGVESPIDNQFNGFVCNKEGEVELDVIHEQEEEGNFSIVKWSLDTEVLQDESCTSFEAQRCDSHCKNDGFSDVVPLPWEERERIGSSGEREREKGESLSIFSVIDEVFGEGDR